MLEREAIFVSSVFACFPDIWGEALGEERFGTSWEMWEFSDIIPVFEVGSHHGSVGISLSWFWNGSGDGRSVLGTHEFFSIKLIIRYAMFCGL